LQSQFGPRLTLMQPQYLLFQVV